MPALRDEGRRHREPGAGRRALRGEPAVLRRPEDLGREPEGRRQAARGGRAHARREVHAQLHALLAPQDADHLPRDDAVVRRDGRRARLSRREAGAIAARDRAGGHRAHAVLPLVGQGAPARDDRASPGLDALAPAAMGRAAAVLRRPRDRRTAPRHARAPGARRAHGRRARHRGVVRVDVRGLRRRREALPQAHRHARRVVRLGLDAPDRDGRARGAHEATRLPFRRHRVPGRPLPRGLGPAPRLVPLVAARLLHAERRAALPRPPDARLRRRRRRQEDVEVEGQRRGAAEGVRHARRRHPPAVGGRDRLLGRPQHLRRDPQAQRRGLPAHPQHAALPAREHVRLRARRRDPGGETVRGRPLRARAPRRARRGRGAGLRPLRVPPGRPEAHHLLLRGPRRVLPRRAEGPPLHDRRGECGAPLGADRARVDPRRAADAPRAGALVHGGGGVADPASGRSDDLRAHVARGGPDFVADGARCSASGRRSSPRAPRC